MASSSAGVGIPSLPSLWANVRGLAGLHAFVEALGGNLLLCLFQLQMAPYIFLGSRSLPPTPKTAPLHLPEPQFIIMILSLIPWSSGYASLSCV